MKRLLAVILVLGMGSPAKAVILEVEGEWWPGAPDTESTITVIGEDTSNWLGYIIVDADGSGTLSGIEVLPGAGNQSSATLYDVEPDWGLGYELTAASTSVPTDVAVGPQFTLNYSYSGVLWDPTTVSLYIDPEYEIPAAQLQHTHPHWPRVYIQVDGKTGPKAFVEPDTKALITVVSEDASNWLGYITVEEGGSGELSNPVALDAAGNLGSAGGAYYQGYSPGYDLTAAMSLGGVPPVAAGPQFTFDYSYSGDLAEGTTISLFIDPQYEIPESSVEIIPEPMTVVLLGLGGVLLRRCKQHVSLG